MKIFCTILVIVTFCGLDSKSQDIDPDSFDFDDFDASTPKFEYTTLDPYLIFPTEISEPETTLKEILETTTKQFSEWPIDNVLNSTEVVNNLSDESSIEVTTKLVNNEEDTEQTTVKPVIPDNSDENTGTTTEETTTCPEEQEKKGADVEKSTEEEIREPEERGPKIYFTPEIRCEENCGENSIETRIDSDEVNENTNSVEVTAGKPIDEFGNDFIPIPVPDEVLNIFQQLGNWRAVGLADPLPKKATTAEAEAPEEQKPFDFRYNLTPSVPLLQECYYKVKDGPYWMNEDLEYGRLFDASSVRRCFHCCETSIFERCSHTYLSNCGLRADNIQHHEPSRNWYNTIYPNNFNQRTCKLVTYWIHGTQVRKIIC